jgi:hypothetical protein
MGTRKTITGSTVVNPTIFADLSSVKQANSLVLMHRISENLAAIGRLLLLQLQAPLVVEETLDNPNLFVEAAKRYGDVRGYSSIMAMSDDVSTPIMLGPVTLKFPREPASFTEIRT